MTKKDETVVTDPISDALGGGHMVDASNCLYDLMRIFLNIPKKDPTKLFKLDEEGRPVRENDRYILTDYKHGIGVPFILWGFGGIGKSSILDELAESLGGPFTTIFPVTKQPDAFDTVLVSTPQGVQRHVIIGELAEVIDRGEDGVVFFDDLSQAHDSVQAALMPLFLSRQIGSAKLGRLVRMVAAANPPKHATYGNTLGSTFSNRCAHIWVGIPPQEARLKYITEQPYPYTHQLDIHNLVANWREAWGYYKSLWIGFNSSPLFEKLGHKQPASGSAQESYAWPSLRSTEYAFRGLATARALGIKQLNTEIVAAFIGPGPAIELVEWMNALNIPTIEDMVTEKWQPRPSRPDVTYVAYNSLVEHMKNVDLRNEQAKLRRYAELPIFYKLLVKLTDNSIGMVDYSKFCLEQVINTIFCQPNQLKKLGYDAEAFGADLYNELAKIYSDVK